MRSFGWVGLALLLGSSGCFGGSGASGRPSIMFGDCDGDCPLAGNPLAAGGARTTLSVMGDFASVRVSNPAIATLTLDPSKPGAIDVVTGIAGTTEVELLDARGALLASSALTVEDTALLSASRGWTTPTPLILAAVPFVFHVTTVDAGGQTTRGDGSVAFTLGGTLSPSEIAVGSGDAIGFSGAPGTGTISAGAPTATLSQTVTVLPSTAITTLNASVAPTAPASGVAVVVIVPQSAGGPVYTDACVWRTSDPSVTLQSVVGPTLDLGPGELGIFNVTRAGSFTVTCSAAGMSATVTLTR